MFRSLLGRFDEIEELFSRLTDAVEDCLKSSFDAIKEFREKGETDRVCELFKQAHQAESKADEVGREILDIILQGSLLPNTRGDLMSLIDTIDDVADHAEEILDSIILLLVDISKIDSEKLDRIFELLEKQFTILKKAVKSLFNDMDLALGQTPKLEVLETEIDDLEIEIKRNIAKRTDIEIAEKIAYSNLITQIADLADIIENVGDKIEIFIAVRRG